MNFGDSEKDSGKHSGKEDKRPLPPPNDSLDSEDEAKESAGFRS